MKKPNAAPINFDATKKPGPRFSLPDDIVNEVTYFRAITFGHVESIRKIMNSEGKNET